MFTFRFFLICSLLYISPSYAQIFPQISWEVVDNKTYKLQIVTASTDSGFTLWNCGAYGTGCSISGTIAKQNYTLPKTKLTVYGSSMLPNEKGVANSMKGISWNVPADNESRCVDFIVTTMNGDFPISQACADKAPAITQCNISESEITLDHDTLSSDRIENNTVSKMINVRCNKSSAFSVTATNLTGSSDRITLSPTLNSSLKIDGKPGAEGVEANGTTAKSFSVSSTLNQSGSVGAGSYSASGIIKVEYF